MSNSSFVCPPSAWGGSGGSGNAWLAPMFCAVEFPVDINQPRSVISMGPSDVIALERGSQSIVYLADTDGDGLPDTISATIGTAPSLNHGLTLSPPPPPASSPSASAGGTDTGTGKGYVYASSDSAVYRWSYDDESDLRTGDVGEREDVVTNINENGQGGAPQGHRTRTLVLDDDGRLYVSVGSHQNVDADSFRSRIRRFDISDESAFPLDFLRGEVFADGLRNEVGLAFDRHGVLWGVENGADRLHRSDLGGDIHNDNPAEELNRFPEEDKGAHWGYPYCWSEFILSEEFAMGRGTAWAWPSFLAAGNITDEACRQDYMTSELSMQAHSAPLGIVFYRWRDPTEFPSECGIDGNGGDGGGAFPREMDGYAFIAFHGSWNRDVPTGYKVVYVPMDETGRVKDVDTSPRDLLMHIPPDAKWEDGFRPVDVDFDPCGRLIVSSDGTRVNGNIYRGGKIVRISYEGGGDGTGGGSGADSPTSDPTSMIPTPFPSTLEPTASATSSPTTLSPTEAPMTETTTTTSPLPSSIPSSSSSSSGTGTTTMTPPPTTTTTTITASPTTSSSSEEKEDSPTSSSMRSSSRLESLLQMMLVVLLVFVG